MKKIACILLLIGAATAAILIAQSAAPNPEKELLSVPKPKSPFARENYKAVIFDVLSDRIMETLSQLILTEDVLKRLSKVSNREFTEEELSRFEETISQSMVAICGLRGYMTISAQRIIEHEHLRTEEETSIKSGPNKKEQ